MAFLQPRENESWLVRILNYLQSINKPEPPSILETWNRIRPTSSEDSSESSSTDERTSPRLSGIRHHTENGRRSRFGVYKFLLCSVTYT